MSSLNPEVRTTHRNPLDLVEKLAVANDWPFHRQSDEELAAEIAGQWCHYKLWFAWAPEMGVMHLSCALDMKVPEKKKHGIYELLALANDKLWIGHFDLWSAEGVVMFRQALLLSGGAEPNTHQVERLLVTAIEACERYFQAFQFVVWAGKDAAEALEGVLFETVGEA